jgi:hypothetical protein
MANLRTGSSEHCQKDFRFELWHAGFGDMSYAYCDGCGMVATIDYSNKDLSKLPPISPHYQVIDTELEPFLHPCACGGRFRKGAFPRCPHCKEPLSAEYAAGHIERSSPGSAKGWRWQRSWVGLYCIAIEDTANPGTLRRIKDPYCGRE